MPKPSPASLVPASTNATRADDSRPQSPDGALVIVVSGAAKGASVRLPGGVGAAIRIGKAADNDLVLPDDTVSRYHLQIRRISGGIQIEDLGSTNGVKIAGARVKEALVEPGTVLRAGEVELAIRLEPRGVEVPASEHDHFGFALGKSLSMRRIFGLLERIAKTQATVLLTGETGTGKDVLARSIHAASPRAKEAFEVVDCGAVTHTLIESELFGHERGAFTGAIASRAGAFERAAGGTLFLDEVGELPLDLQPQLLRALEKREVRPIGEVRAKKVNIRVIAATRRDLPREVERGKFREDLYFRLAVVPIEVPPLRSRLEDVPVLAERILASSASAIGEDGSLLTLPIDTLNALRAHDWPGNVRELRNVLERAAYLARASGDTELRLIGLPAQRGGASDVFTFDPSQPYREIRAKFDAMFETQYVTWLLARHSGNVSAAAREAQMDRKHLADLAKRHGVKGEG